jgi:hypothetical protein
MNPKSLIAPAMFALVVAHDISIQIKAKKARALAVEVLETQEIYAHELVKDYEEKLTAAGAQIQYLIHLLNEHGIEIDEFDLIALNFRN